MLRAGIWSLLGLLQLRGSSSTRHTGAQEQLRSGPRNDGELGQMNQTGSFCGGLQQSKLRRTDSDTPGVGSMGFIHMQFSDGIGRIVVNRSTLNEPSISPFWNTLL